MLCGHRPLGEPTGKADRPYWVSRKSTLVEAEGRTPHLVGGRSPQTQMRQETQEL